MRPVFVCLALFLMSVPAATQPFFAGDWFGQDQLDIKGMMWTAHWEPFGGFRVEFRHCYKGKSYDLQASGRWSLQGNLLAVDTTSVDGHAFAVTDVYEILSHDHQKMSYRHTQSGFVYRASRVAADFKMPRCEMIS
jgi:hypothetical protein